MADAADRTEASTMRGRAALYAAVLGLSCLVWYSYRSRACAEEVPAVVESLPAVSSLPATFERVDPRDSYMFYHHHIPKTAGRSFYRYFQKEGHPDSMVPCPQILHPQHCEDAICPGEECKLFGQYEVFCVDLIAQLAEEYAQTQAYHTCNLLSFESNSLTYDVEQHLQLPNLKVMTMMREPISHYVSQFMHDKHWHRVETMEDYLNQANELGYNIGHNGNLLHQKFGVKTVDEAKALLVEKVFFFGFLDYWPESLCLLSFQLHNFNRDLCNLCSPEALVTPEGGFTVSQKYFLGSKRIGVKEGDVLDDTAITVGQLRRIQELNQKDVHLYTWAVEVFKARIRHLEQAEGVKILCDE